MDDKPKIKKIIQTCFACPSQWDMWTDTDRYVYVRYRWGYFSASYDAAYGIASFFEGVFGDGLDGSMDTDKMKDILKDIFDFSEAKYE